MGSSFANILALNSARVAVCDINGRSAEAVSNSIEQAGGKSQAYEIDVTEANKVETVFNDIEKELGPISILVNNAGLLKPTQFKNIGIDEWQKIMKVNVDGIFSEIDFAGF